MPFPYYIIRPSSFTFQRYPRWADVYWFDFGAVRSSQDRTMAEPHLAVVVSNPAITLKGTVLIVPLSGAEHRKQGYAFHVLVTRRECPKLDKDSIVKVDQIYCVTVKPGLPDQYYLTTFSTEIMRRIYEQVLRVLNVDQIVKALSSS
jgi:mRNA-degrading endonuclease toxin of MazEF toxin-antitoxin module